MHKPKLQCFRFSKKNQLYKYFYFRMVCNTLKFPFFLILFSVFLDSVLLCFVLFKDSFTLETSQMNFFLITPFYEYLWFCNIFFSLLLNFSMIKHYPATEHLKCISCILFIAWVYIRNSGTESGPQPIKKQSPCQNNYSKGMTYSERKKLTF